MTTMDDKYAKRIADLLRMAEAGDDAEAQTALEHAERLMAKYGIDRAVAQSKGTVKDEAIVEKRISFDGIYHKAFLMGASALGNQMNVRLLNYTFGRKVTLLIIGYESDVDNFITLFTSIMLQSVTSANKAIKDVYMVDLYKPSEKFNFRRSHILGFFSGAASRIQRNRQQTFTETSGSELAVRDRMTEVEKKVTELYPDVQSRSTKMKISGGYSGGYEAGQNAMTGDKALKQKGQLES